MIFFVSNKKEISYSELINQINKGTTADFFCSFVADLVTNTDIDLSSYTLNKKCGNIESIEDLKNKILSSKSKIILKTSGTTGNPKRKTHNVSFLISNTKDLKSRNCWLFTYNKFHMGGVQVLLQALRNLDTIIDVYKQDREYVFRMIEEYTVTNISATPTFYRMLLPVEKSFASVKRATVGGERTDSATIKIINKYFPNCKINNIYATTETGAILFSSTEVFELNSNVVVKDNILFVKDPDGGLHDTGDLVEMLDDKRFRFSGRNKNIINIAGNNVNPTEIEDILKQHDAVKDAVIYEKKNRLLGNVLTCDVVLVYNTKEAELRTFLKQRIEQNYKIPRIINFKDCLKISDSNKVLR